MVNPRLHRFLPAGLLLGATLVVACKSQQNGGAGGAGRGGRPGAGGDTSSGGSGAAGTGTGGSPGAGGAAGASATGGAGGSDTSHWVGTWTGAPQLTETGNLPPTPLSNLTLRQVVHVSLGGSQIRVRFSNEFGDGPVTINQAHVAVCPAGIGAGPVSPCGPRLPADGSTLVYPAELTPVSRDLTVSASLDDDDAFGGTARGGAALTGG